jgi:hypothetical protein
MWHNATTTPSRIVFVHQHFGIVDLLEYWLYQASFDEDTLM